MIHGLQKTNPVYLLRNRDRTGFDKRGERL